MRLFAKAAKLSSHGFFAGEEVTAPAASLRAGSLAPRAGEPAGGAGTGRDADQDVLDLIAGHKLEAALRVVMHRHGDSIFRYCLVHLHDDALAEDVQQQVFIQAHRDFHRFAGRSALRTWLFGIAHHRVQDAHRRRKVEVPLDETLLGQLVDTGRSADQTIDDGILRQALALCLGELGDHVRTAVLLRYQQGFSFEDMAEITGEKPGTLQARVTRALPVLRACIEGRTGGAL